MGCGNTKTAEEAVQDKTKIKERAKDTGKGFTKEERRAYRLALRQQIESSLQTFSFGTRYSDWVKGQSETVPSSMNDAQSDVSTPRKDAQPTPPNKDPKDNSGKDIPTVQSGSEEMSSEASNSQRNPRPHRAVTIVEPPLQEQSTAEGAVETYRQPRQSKKQLQALLKEFRFCADDGEHAASPDAEVVQEVSQRISILERDVVSNAAKIVAHRESLAQVAHVGVENLTGITLSKRHKMAVKRYNSTAGLPVAMCSEEKQESFDDEDEDDDVPKSSPSTGTSTGTAGSSAERLDLP